MIKSMEWEYTWNRRMGFIILVDGTFRFSDERKNEIRLTG